jgi:rubrerythrin
MASDIKHPEGTGRERLLRSTTIGEVLETAMSFERSARDFYAGLKDRVSKPLRELVSELAEEEARHYRLFEELRARPDVGERVADRIARPASDHRFSDYVHLPSLGDNPDDQAILQYAMGREHAAMEQYGALAGEVPAGPIRDLFRFLAQEELQHKQELEKRYYALVFPSAV